MEKYSFVKYLKYKEKNIKKKIKYLEKQLGGGQHVADFRELAFALAKLKEALTVIDTNTKGDGSNQPTNVFTSFITQFDEINNQLLQINTNIYERNNVEGIINKIKELNISIENGKVIANAPEVLTTERVSSKSLHILMDKFIKNHEEFAKDFENRVSVIRNEDLHIITVQLAEKIKEYEKSFTQFEEIHNNLKINIKLMKSVFNDIEIDPNTVGVIPDSNEDIIINIPKIDDTAKNDSLKVASELAIVVEEGKEINELVGPINGHDQSKLNQEPKINSLNIKGGSIEDNITQISASTNKLILQYYKEWLIELNNYKKHLEIKLSNIDKTNKTDKTNKYFFIGGVDKTVVSNTDIPPNTDNKASSIDLVKKTSEYAESIKKIQKLSSQINESVKVYNITYALFFNYQKYIVNYAALIIPEGGYSYYQYMSKGNISFFDSLLTKLGNTLDKFNNYPKEDDESFEELKKPTIRWLYRYHYFIIKILQNFFNKLYQFWETKDHYEKSKPDNEKIWGLDHLIKTKVEGNTNTGFFYLFNTFHDKLFEYYNTEMPPVANYIKINRIRINDDHVVTFEKRTDNKNLLKMDNLNLCPYTNNEKSAFIKDEVSKIEFTEIFDPDKFKENDGIPYYMGLTDFINKGKSMMILTYGYSGVGKSYTLFGNPADNNSNPKKNAVEGMLQSTLKRLGSGIEIQVKIFELYGLGVPYKFYWENPENFSHCIYDYKIQPNGDVNHSKKNKKVFPTYLEINNNKEYLTLNNNQITNFTLFINKIDEIRRKEGRIKATLNNPDSSRSIMIYDFKIKINKNKPYTHFVIMDLPGKEDIYQTYCNNTDPNYELQEKYKVHKIVSVSKFTKDQDYTEATLKSNNEYNHELLKKMVYTNQLWLSMIPEIAKSFDIENLQKKQLFSNKEIPEDSIKSLKVNRRITIGIKNDKDIILHPINNEKIRQDYNTRIKDACAELNLTDPRLEALIKKQNKEQEREAQKKEKQEQNEQNDQKSKQTSKTPVASVASVANNTYDDTSDDENETLYHEINSGSNNHNSEQSKESTVIYEIDKNPHILNIFTNSTPLMHRQYKHYTKTDETKELTLNDMTLRQLIRLRLLGLSERSLHNIVKMIKGDLEELGAKLNNMLKDEDKRNKRYGYAGLEGIYINENILGLLQVLANKVQSKNNHKNINIVCEQTEIYKTKNGSDILLPLWDVGIDGIKLLKDDEFFSFIHYLNEYQRKVFPSLKKEIKFDRVGEVSDAFYNKFREPAFSDKVNQEELSNYDYNKIFNINDPPIKKILEPYLGSIDNYFLFFVVSNNNKENPLNKGEYNIQTCDKQMQLLYDTRHFMKIIAGKTDINLQCDAN